MRDDFVTFFCPQGQADFPSYREEFGSCLILVGSNGPTKIPEKERSEDPHQYLHRVKKALNNGGLLIAVRAQGNSPKASVGIVESATYPAPRKMLRLSIDRSPEWVELGGLDKRAVDVDLRLGDHLVVPASLRSEEVLDNLLRALKYLPQDCEMNVLNVIRRPSLEWRVARLERAAGFERMYGTESSSWYRVAAGGSQGAHELGRSWWQRLIKLNWVMVACFFLCIISGIVGFYLHSYISSNREKVSGHKTLNAPTTLRSDNKSPAAPPTRNTAVHMSPEKLDFGDQKIRMQSDPKTTTLSNVGDEPEIVEKVDITGTNKKDFTENHVMCGNSVSAGDSCDISVFFKPGAIGKSEATLDVTFEVSHDSQGSHTFVKLMGKGIPSQENKKVELPQPKNTDRSQSQDDKKQKPKEKP